jgi:hypothetical protein
MLLSALFTHVLTPSHKDFVKAVKENPDAYNPLLLALEGTVYKGGLRSYDGFRGIYNAVDYLGDNFDPPIYQFPIKLTTDVAKTVFGDKTFMDILTGNVAPFRAF